jgi:SNF2 family DNA or RNA helicase
MLEQITNVTDYLKAYGAELAEKIKREAEPLFNPGDPWDNKIGKLLRRPYQAQGDAMMGLIKALEEKHSAIVVGEMGSGKTIIGCSIPYISMNGKGPSRTLIMCPGHLVKKWKREIEETIPEARASIVRQLKDVAHFKNNGGMPEAPEYVIISKDKAKLGYAWRPAVIERKGKDGYYCPSCGRVVVDKDGNPVSLDYLKRNRRFCKCGSALWQADNNKLRRFAVAEYIKKHLKGYFDFFIADEVHELKGGSTAQGNSFGALASSCEKTIALTGTLVGGYGDDIHYIIGRLSPQALQREGIGYGEIAKWMARYGVLERITRSNPEDNIYSRGKKKNTTVKKKPGISPMVFSNYLMDRCVFLHLADIALDLPPITETVVQVEMDEDLEDAYKKLESDLLAAVRAALQQGSKALLGTYLNALLSYPDRPFDNDIIRDPNPERKDSIIAIPKDLPKETTYNKEEQLIKLVMAELAEGRRVFIYCQYTNTKDVTARLKDTLQSNGVKAEILKSSVAPEKREEWVLAKVKEGVKVVIANPKLVETGLDLYDFPTMIFYQTGYSVFTLRQASRRSWRIGQRKDVKIYYLFYKGTMQERALQLMGSKMEASLAIEGKFSEEGLLAMTQGEDMTTAMAKALVEGLDVEGAEQIWKKLNQANTKAKPRREEPVEPEPGKPTLTPEEKEEDPDKVVFVDFVTYLSKRKKKVETVAVRTAEMDKLLQEKQADGVQLSLFG